MMVAQVVALKPFLVFCNAFRTLFMFRTTLGESFFLRPRVSTAERLCVTPFAAFRTVERPGGFKFRRARFDPRLPRISCIVFPKRTWAKMKSNSVGERWGAMAGSLGNKQQRQRANTNARASESP